MFMLMLMLMLMPTQRYVLHTGVHIIIIMNTYNDHISILTQHVQYKHDMR